MAFVNCSGEWFSRARETTAVPRGWRAALCSCHNFFGKLLAPTLVIQFWWIPCNLIYSVAKHNCINKLVLSTPIVPSQGIILILTASSYERLCYRAWSRNMSVSTGQMVIVSHCSFYRGRLLNVRITDQNKRNCHNVSKNVSCDKKCELWQQLGDLAGTRTLLHGISTQSNTSTVYVPRSAEHKYYGNKF